METTVNFTPARQTSSKGIQPMGWIETFLAVLFPAAAMILAHYVTYPYLKNTGVNAFVSYTIATLPVMIGMLFASLFLYHREGNAWTWTAFSDRFRLTRMSRRAWLWTGAAVIVYLVLGQLANTLLMLLFSAFNFTPINFAFGAPIPLLALVGLLFNIIGEEFWWRGYILPRQEARFGRWAWLVNGTMWAFFHLYKWWGLPGLLIVCQIIPFLSQRLKNNWPAFLLHFLLNGAGMVAALIMMLLK